MKIHALTVCVDYADFLEVGAARWADKLASWTIVTRNNDTETLRLVRDMFCSYMPGGCMVQSHVTDAFYRDGAIFNKGRAMEEARKVWMPWEDWILFVDADVVPPADWHQRLVAFKPRRGHLYGARRVQCGDPTRPDDDWGPPLNDGVGVGYFQLFHSKDPNVVERHPVVPTGWKHGGNYDNDFLRRWPRQQRALVPFRLAHLGERDNWCGRGNDEAMRELMAERAKRVGQPYTTFDHERIEIGRP